jgi:hypothetical protein
LTHAEAKDLVLDLAYGELPAHVAAEVELHVTSCAECREERANIGFVRSSFAPIREAEQPSRGFDAKVLAASKAEAQFTHDGNIGQVVEVSASAAPMSLPAARVDAHAAPVAGPREKRRRPKWMLPAALSSLAAAAALVLVVSTNRGSEKASRASGKGEYAIELKAPEAPAPAPKDRAFAPPPPPAAPAGELAAPAPEPAAPAARQEERRDDKPALALQKAAPKRKKEVIPPGAGGDAADSSAFGLRNASGGSVAAQDSLGAQAPKEKGSAANEVAPATLDKESKADKQVAEKETAPPQSIAHSEHQIVAMKPVAAPPSAAASAPAAAPPPAKVAAASASEARAVSQPPAADLERRAESARHAGNYPLAAGLYRQAAAHRKDDPGDAAWDLAHAIECLSAAGSFDEARSVREELLRDYPGQKNAASAASRALREVEATPAGN